jgi:aspartyl-tRNA(Asn)/glutamyl-tRNA(Gln) amidotransferase subunit C
MPQLTLQQVEHVALLARLELTQDEKIKLTEELNVILEHFERLQELDTTAVEPTSHVISMQNVLRSDEVRPSLPRDVILAEAPDAREGYFVVPRIVEV